MRVMVFGATGVIGDVLVPLMIRAGHRVTAVGRSPERLRNLESQGAATIALDLFDRDAVKRAIAWPRSDRQPGDAASRAGSRILLPRAWKETDRIREYGSALLVDEALAAGVQAFIQESFAPIYEEGGDRWMTEDAPTRPVRYNKTTLKAEASADRFARRRRARNRVALRVLLWTRRSVH